MNKAEMTAKLKAFPYDPAEYWVITGGAMVLYGIREETADMDLGCTTALAERLEQEGYLYKVTSDGNRWFKIGEDIEVFENWLYDTTEQICGIPVISLQGLIEMKKQIGREKDFRDIRLIRDYLARNGKPGERNEKNPWEEISLDDYENHMSLDSVRQLQTMNAMMKEQFEAYPVQTAMVLGVAGGNGIEHARPEKYRTVYCVDINEVYLQAVRERFARQPAVQCLRADLTEEADRLPRAELVIANLLIEYIGYPAFTKVIRKVDPDCVSCVIQINTDEKNWVSDSPYLHAFDGLDRIHHQMEEGALTAEMKQAGYEPVLRKAEALPNGKALVRLDYRKTGRRKW